MTTNLDKLAAQVPRRGQVLPLYYRIELTLRRAIENGEFEGGRLPTEEALVERFGVSRMTVRAALQRLEEDGLIERHRSRGTFVREEAIAKIERNPDRLLDFEGDLRRQGISPRIEVLSVTQEEPPRAVADMLGDASSGIVYRVRRLGRVGGDPLWLESHYYTLSVGAQMIRQDLTSAALTRMLEEALALRVREGRIRIEAVAANAGQARHLKIRAGRPLLVYQAVFYDTQQRALEVLRAAFRGDRYAVAVNLPSHPLGDLDSWEVEHLKAPGIDPLASLRAGARGVGVSLEPSETGERRATRLRAPDRLRAHSPIREVP